MRLGTFVSPFSFRLRLVGGLEVILEMRMEIENLPSPV
jgi:hypothetical protein